MDIWAKCRDRVSPEPISNELIRVVESQEQIATNSLVENFDEQATLERLLDNTKPAPPRTERAMDYLLVTPFRYPPLPHGSRFGARQESSLLYGSLSLTTAFAETGYYRFLFWRGMVTPPASGKFVTQHTVFGVNYATQRGFKLQAPPFSDYTSYLMSPSEYTATQKLGADMRSMGIEAFEYRSARDIDHGLNAALFTPDALSSTKPRFKEQWLCETTSNTVTFFSAATKRSLHKYPLDTYLVDDHFPEPAF
ncbi:MAG: hypothetical protein AMJ53_00665 [Gammaproteobacteria bacterium SG8_11]|nr:MAG: hypothetical protein AMJ53_00665 [Gammaproteobacteria bacterium SG8_11]